MASMLTVAVGRRATASDWRGRSGEGGRPAAFDPQRSPAVLNSPPLSCRSDRHKDNHWRPRSGVHMSAGDKHGEGVTVHGLRLRRPTMSGDSRASQQPVAQAAAGCCPCSLRSPPPRADRAVPLTMAACGKFHCPDIGCAGMELPLFLPGRARRRSRRGRGAHAAAGPGSGCHLPHSPRATRRSESAGPQGRDTGRDHGAPAARQTGSTWRSRPCAAYTPATFGSQHCRRFDTA